MKREVRREAVTVEIPALRSVEMVGMHCTPAVEYAEVPVFVDDWTDGHETVELPDGRETVEVSL